MTAPGVVFRAQVCDVEDCRRAPAVLIVVIPDAAAPRCSFACEAHREARRTFMYDQLPRDPAEGSFVEIWVAAEQLLTEQDVRQLATEQLLAGHYSRFRRSRNGTSAKDSQE